MREILSLNAGWLFSKQKADPAALDTTGWEAIDLPHTWNNVDGMDGGSDYHRGTCYYTKKIVKAELPQAERYYLEINGANSSADVYAGGKHMAHHDGGYSTWRVELTEVLGDELELTIAVDNAPNNTVYPQIADFTFYGGLYRNVNMICTSAHHFELVKNGHPGIHVTPTIEGADARARVELFPANAQPEHTYRYTLLEADGTVVATHTTANTKIDFKILNVHLWNGRKDPYLYTLKAELLNGEEVLDTISTRFGCRSYSVDPDRGFILNGEEYPLRGVARHQDRWGVGNALTRAHHEEDVELICEVGCTTIRLAHYQHDQYFYDLCDEAGLVIWAEIPYISQHMPTGRANTISQMTELVTQNYNHACICMWGLSNEITMKGAEDPDLIENHKILNDLVHKLDATRPTTIAALSNCPMTASYIKIPDLVSYNHYFGWYGGETDMNGPWFDKFHATNPTIPIGVSEYGCEALNWHTSNPMQGDYTEEYQAYYHEELIKQLFSRKFIWATHCWNMFDFGADTRNEGGENGQNHKGLVTIDRKYKKDAFYAYKAWLSDDPFVHLCGKRYVDRVEDVTKVTVYSNLPEVELFANGESLGKKTAEDHFFYFDVPNVGETTLKVVAGEFSDEGTIRKVDTFNEEYRMKEKGAILNWFDIESPEGKLSLNSKVSDVIATFRGKLLFAGLVRKALPKGKKGGDSPMAGFKVTPELFDMVGGFTVIRLVNMMGGMVGAVVEKDDLLAMNKKLNRINAPKAKKK